NRKSDSGRILMPASVHPYYRQVAHNICAAQGIVHETLPYDENTGRIDQKALAELEGRDFAAVVIPQPNFFGVVDAIDELVGWAHRQGALAIAAVNPMAMGLLTPPGEWGEDGADIACGEGQPLGIPLSSGGPYFGFMCCKQKYLRQLPGRLIGRGKDTAGRTGYTMTLQAREQHIRRSKATSNICTNQGLMVTAATIYMALLGPAGLQRVAATSAANTRKLAAAAAAQRGVRVLFDRPHFHELVLALPRPAAELLPRMAAAGVLGGLDLEPYYPELGPALLVCATETKTDEDIDHYQRAL